MPTKKRDTIILAVLAAAGAIAVIAAWQTGRRSGPGASETNTDAQAVIENSGPAVIGEDVDYFGDARGYFVRPERGGKYPGVVMIHEWWGLNDNIRAMARELADEGYLVLAVDLYGGAVATTPEEARGLVSSIDKEDAVANLQAAVRYLQARNAQRVASLGWCFGGGQSLQLALSGQKLDATVIYYGTLVTDPKSLSKIDWPVLGVFGDKDASIPVAEVKKFEAALDTAGVMNEIYVYPDVGHAFANPSGQNFAPEETKDAWEKTLHFLDSTLN